MSEHSPIPWTAQRSSLTGRIDNILDRTGREVRLSGFSISGSEEAAGNSEIVVRAVNAHDALVDALREAEAQIAYLHGKFQATGTGEAVLVKIRSALARAEQQD